VNPTDGIIDESASHIVSRGFFTGRRCLAIGSLAIFIAYLVVPYAWGRATSEDTSLPPICSSMPAWRELYTLGWEASGKPGKPRTPWRRRASESP
jgi:hypothetical protein